MLGAHSRGFSGTARRPDRGPVRWLARSVAEMSGLLVAASTSVVGGLFFASSMFLMTGIAYGREARRRIRGAELCGDEVVAYRTRCYFWVMVGLAVIGMVGLVVAVRIAMS